MEIALIGEGEVVIRFIDRDGETLLQERLLVSGPPGVNALRSVPLSISTVRGPVEVAPVVASLSGRRLRVLFDGEAPVRFARRRCKAIGCSASVARNAVRGVAPAPLPRGPGMAMVAGPEMLGILRAAARPPGRRR